MTRYKGKLVGALMGLALLKLPGLVVGLWLGHLLDKRLSQGKHYISQPDLFISSLLFCFGYLARSAGYVQQAHINYVGHLMVNLAVKGKQKRLGQDAFTRGKQPDAAVAEVLHHFYRSSWRDRASLQLFLDKLIEGLLYCGQNSTQDFDNLVSIGLQLGFAKKEVLESIDRHIEQIEPESGMSLHEAYELLDVPFGSSLAVVKKAYKKGMSKCHPDKLVGSGLNEEQLNAYKQQAQALQRAYEQIKTQ